jgi:hypothetical protein
MALYNLANPESQSMTARRPRDKRHHAERNAPIEMFVKNEPS